MQLRNSFLALLLLVGAVGTANAVPATWVDDVDFNPDRYIPSFGSYSYTHNVLDDGFTPLVDLVYGYDLTVDLYDDRDSFWEPFEIALVDVPGLLGGGDEVFFNLSGDEFGGWSLAGYLQLALTGLFDVTITSAYGDFYLGGSTLTVHGEDRSVPEPGVLGLFSLALLGAGAALRRKKKA